MNRLYAADLVGAGAGCAALPMVLPVLGGSGAVVLAAGVGFLAATVFGLPSARRIGGGALVLCALAFFLALFADQVLPITVSSKRHTLLPAPPMPAPLYTAWNGMSRVDVYPLTAAPTLGWPASGLSIVIDGGSAATGIGDLSAGVEHWLSRDDYQPPGLAYVGKERPRVLILGSGAGPEVLEALYFGASSVTAVEMNPIITDIVTHRMREAFGGLFERPSVHLVTDEGRSFMRRSEEKYDAIISVQTNSAAALASGALGLAESFMFTREAFEDYLDHLTADGVLLITRSPNQVARLFATVREVFERRGLGSPAHHLLAVQTPPPPWGPRHDLTVFLFKKSVWTQGEVRVLEQRLAHDRSSASADGGGGLKFLYSPFEGGSGNLYSELLAASDLPKFYAAQSIDVSPATDDRPFFNNQARWLQVSLRAVSDPSNPAGAELMLILLLPQVTFIAAALILLPLASHSRQGLRVSGCGSFLTYFAGLGLGFIMIEIALLKRSMLFLGEPVYSLAVVLGSLLIFTGAGAYVGQYFSRRAASGIIGILLATLTTLVLTSFVMDWVFHAALGFALPWRIGIAAVLIAPLGILLGMSFPAGLRVIGVVAPALVPWAWGVNGFFTVIGSVLAMMLGMIFGFTTVLVAAGGCYVISLAIVHLGRWKELVGTSSPALTPTGRAVEPISA
ncbi:MAG: hypothetical protein WBE89_03555 [Methyloceanibacter sp.]